MDQGRQIEDDRPSVMAFTRTWNMLAVEGACDGAFGAEYDRVLSEWEAAGRPIEIGKFIRDRANILAE